LENQEGTFQKGCRCGSGRPKTKNENSLSCKDGIRKTKCPCVAGGNGCTSNCRCLNCGNIFKTGGIPASPVIPRKRRREAILNYKRQKGSDWMINEGATLSAGPWELMEILCVLVCREMLLRSHLPTVSCNFAQLYTFIADSTESNSMSLGIKRKTTSQVAAKIKHLNKCSD